MKFFKFIPPWRGKQRNKAFTLVETLVAISIFTVSLLGLMSILASGISDTNYAKQKIVASYLAQEGIEYVRNVRDTDVLYTATTGNTWDTFKSAVAAPNFYPSPSAYSTFNRQITLTPINTDEVKISSKVSWTQGSGSFSITFSENLFNWVE